MSSLTPDQLARIEQNRQDALASVNIVRNLFDSPPSSKVGSDSDSTQNDFIKYSYNGDVSPDSQYRGSKRPFDVGDGNVDTPVSKFNKTPPYDQSERTNIPFDSPPQTQTTQQDPSTSKTPSFTARSIFGATKHSTPGKNGNIADMIKSMAPITPEKREEQQRRQRNYSPLLSNEQCHVLDLVLDGKSLFFTGSAGTGKSFLLREIVKELSKVRPAGTVFVTATTGIAACNIDGSTIHSYSGIGYGEDSKEVLADRINKKARHKKRWGKTKVLVIDEISMLSGELFDKLEYIARTVRKNDCPFGGIQVILCGDFFQLPPVTKRSSSVDFCFEARSWKRVVTDSVELTKVFRQADERFVRILNQIRHGIVTNESDSAFKATLNNSLSIESADGHEIVATRLEPFRKEVTSENNRRLSELPGVMYVLPSTYTEIREIRAKVKSAEVEFKAIDKGAREQLEILEKNCAAPSLLELKVDAQVILLKNIAAGREGKLVNGSRGVVVGFEQVRDEKRGEERMLPVVKFSSGAKMTLGVEEWSIDMGGKVLASRQQIPLALAWCLSIHKSQGQTIELVEMSLSNVFESGQAYVALSRAVSLGGLKVLSFDRSKIRAHPKVITFYQKLNSSTSSTYGDNNYQTNHSQGNNNLNSENTNNNKCSLNNSTNVDININSNRYTNMRTNNNFYTSTNNYHPNNNHTNNKHNNPTSEYNGMNDKPFNSTTTKTITTIDSNINTSTSTNTSSNSNIIDDDEVAEIYNHQLNNTSTNTLTNTSTNTPTNTSINDNTTPKPPITSKYFSTPTKSKPSSPHPSPTNHTSLPMYTSHKTINLYNNNNNRSEENQITIGSLDSVYDELLNENNDNDISDVILDLTQ